MQQGQFDSFLPFFEQYKPIVLKMMRTYYLKGFEDADWFQEAMLSFYQTILRYDPEKGHTFGNFFKLSFKHHIFSLIRKDAAQKRKIDKEYVSLDAIYEKNGQQELMMNDQQDDITYKQVTIHEDFTEYFQQLSPYEKKVFNQNLYQQSISDIAETLSCEENQVKNGLERCRKKLRNSFY
ncbi:sigma-70 family RNA polymerase sigma factor [Isobaculum melis]|nr:sigma-70 family RNA polymerase sigma factor [Isobaculum melis]